MNSKTAAAAGALLLGAAAIWYAGFAGDSAPVADAAEPGARQAGPEVSFIRVEETDIRMTERLPGRTSAFRLAEVRPQVNGIIISRLFEEGAQVEEGQALYQIDAAVYEAAVASAEAALLTARANARAVDLREDRYSQLVDSEAISQQDYDDVEAAKAQAAAAVLAAEAALRTARINLDYTRVYAPISGQISQSLMTEGALVSANQSQPLAVITQIDPIYVDLMQSSTEHMKMRAALASAGKIPVTLDSGETGLLPQKMEGSLQFSSVYVNPTTGAVQLRTMFSNPDRLLLPGMFVHASLQLGSQRAMLIPQQSTQRDANGELTVWRLAADDTVNPVPVSVQREMGDQWLLASGLNPGDRIIVQGFQKIAPGMQVVPLPY